MSRGKWEDLVSIISDLPNYATVTHFPYDTLGIIALVVLFLMAATSHDLWLELLGPPLWKTLHMAVYIAYGVLPLAHVTYLARALTLPAVASFALASFAWMAAATALLVLLAIRMMRKRLVI